MSGRARSRGARCDRRVGEAVLAEDADGLQQSNLGHKGVASGRSQICLGDIQFLGGVEYVDRGAQAAAKLDAQEGEEIKRAIWYVNHLEHSIKKEWGSENEDNFDKERKAALKTIRAALINSGAGR